MGDYLRDYQGKNQMAPPVSDEAPVTMHDYEQMVAQVPGLARTLPPIVASSSSSGGGGAAAAASSSRSNGGAVPPVMEWTEEDDRSDSEGEGEDAYETQEGMESMALFASQADEVTMETVPVRRRQSYLTLTSLYMQSHIIIVLIGNVLAQEPPAQTQEKQDESQEVRRMGCGDIAIHTIDKRA